ncbi:MAG: preprotein translocase subunit SecE [Myxococcales bacterium]|nr:preprotein translocase subunit SecE [Myxococcales bacterium]
MTKLIHGVWLKLATLKPQVGEPRDDILIILSAGVGAAAAVYYWRRTRARQLAEEVAQELSKVTWPTKQEVTNSTTVVIVTTAVATVFFALMDRFWSFITNFVYGI